MKVLVVGSGGREHTIAWKISQSPLLETLYCAPGNAGTSQLAHNVQIAADDIDSLLDFAKSKSIDLTIVGPEAPLVKGIADHFEKNNFAVVGPSQAAAILEGSKAFAKDFMKRHSIPTAAYQMFDDIKKAELALKNDHFGFPVVLKADGLAAGKGVFVCPDLAKALEALNIVMGERKFGAAGDRLVIEEFLEGEEVSFMVFSDGVNILPMVPSQDHKAIHEGDRGPNTGGMGAYSVDGILSDELRQQILDEVIHPVIRGMSEEGRPYRGILYAGLMIAHGKPKVLEFNVRLGDPETQVVIPRLKSDLLPVLQEMALGGLKDTRLQWSSDVAVCVVMAAGGYPESYEKGKEISGLEMVGENEHTVTFHAGTAFKKGKVVSDGGRVLGVTSLAPTLRAAIIGAYEGINKLHFDGMYYRRDIASKGISKPERN
ncbi:MAG: phosphoribosylamine--glycine ligase [Acidobacteriota bacterium]|nr:phosphoribosylamine--glycine ligase [Acidobacteriota bacterium]